MNDKDLEIVGVVNESEHPLPSYATPLSSGVDLHANLKGDFVSLQPMQRKLIPTGIRLQMPDHLEGQVRPRSGMANKKGVTVLNSPGTIDADYRGEVFVNLINLSKTEVMINDGERIAQLVFAPVVRVELKDIVVEELSETVRGEGGHGSTGE